MKYQCLPFHHNFRASVVDTSRSHMDKLLLWVNQMQDSIESHQSRRTIKLLPAHSPPSFSVHVIASALTPFPTRLVQSLWYMPTPNASTFVGLNVEPQSFVASTNDILDALRAQIVARQSRCAFSEQKPLNLTRLTCWMFLIVETSALNSFSPPPGLSKRFTTTTVESFKLVQTYWCL